MKTLALILALCISGFAQTSVTHIRNVTIIDGTGKSGILGDVTVVENYIARIGKPNSVKPRAGDAVTITVRDDGEGIEAGDRAKALGRFWRSSRHQNVPGTGLGLAICADLIGAAGGELRLADGLPRPDGTGHGFAAVVTLPAVTA